MKRVQVRTRRGDPPLQEVMSQEVRIAKERIFTAMRGSYACQKRLAMRRFGVDLLTAMCRWYNRMKP